MRLIKNTTTNNTEYVECNSFIIPPNHSEQGLTLPIPPIPKKENLETCNNYLYDMYSVWCGER